MGKVRARPENGKLFLDFRYQGVRCREQTALDDTPKNRKLVEDLLAKVEQEIDDGIFDYAETFPGSSRAVRFAKSSVQTVSAVPRPAPSHRVVDSTDRTPRVREFAETWFGQMKPEWRPSYQETVLVTLNKYTLPKFGNHRVGSITKADLLDWRAQLCAMERPKGKLSNERINKIIGITRKMLSEAAEQFAFTNPATGIRALRKTKTDIHPFTLEEVRLILDTVRDDYRPYLAVRFYTGMRTGEINALRWRDIDWDGDLILVRNTLYKGQLLAGAKTAESARDIPMIPQVRLAMEQQRQITPKDREWVFTAPEGGPIDPKNFCKRVWTPLLKHLGLTYRRPYQTRHTAATLMLAAGEQPQFVSSVLGHSSTQMLYSTYSRYVRNMTRRDGSAMSNLLGAQPYRTTHV